MGSKWLLKVVPTSLVVGGIFMLGAMYQKWEREESGLDYEEAFYNIATGRWEEPSDEIRNNPSMWLTMKPSLEIHSCSLMKYQQNGTLVRAMPRRSFEPPVTESQAKYEPDVVKVQAKDILWNDD